MQLIALQLTLQFESYLTDYRQREVTNLKILFLSSEEKSVTFFLSRESTPRESHLYAPIVTNDTRTATPA